ncbi:MAG: hypothetical protein ACW976_02640, partial [Candidatus Ranarchaeia archaeon]
MQSTATKRFLIVLIVLTVFLGALPWIHQPNISILQKMEPYNVDALAEGPILGTRLSRALTRLSELQINSSTVNNGGFKPLLSPTIEDTYFAVMTLWLVNRTNSINASDVTRWLLTGYNQSAGTITNNHPSYRYDLTPLAETSLALQILTKLNQTSQLN